MPDLHQQTPHMRTSGSNVLVCVLVPCVSMARSVLLIQRGDNSSSLSWYESAYSSCNSFFCPSVFLCISPAGYPCALAYRRFFFHQSPTVIHLFHTLSGLALAAFNFGEMKGKIPLMLCSRCKHLNDQICLRPQFYIWKIFSVLCLLMS